MSRFRNMAIATAACFSLLAPVAPQALAEPAPASAPAQSASNPFNVKEGDTITAKNFKRKGFKLICFHKLSCTFNPTVTFTVTKVQPTKNGTKIILNGFAGYKGHELFKGNNVVARIGGSNGGMTYAYLDDASTAREVNATATPPRASGSSLGSSSSGSSIDRGTKLSSVNGGFVGKPDPKEAAYLASNPTPWKRSATQEGKKHSYIESVEWNPSKKAFTVNPTKEYLDRGGSSEMGDLFGAGSSLSSSRIAKINAPSLAGGKHKKYEEEAIALGLLDTESLRQQLTCHAMGSALKRGNWNLELGRPATQSIGGQVGSMCNPVYNK